MEVSRIEEYKGGWFVGDFLPSSYETDKFEVCFKEHKKGEEWTAHYHKEADEINYLHKGRMIIQDRVLESGDVFVIRRYEIANPVFLEDCEVFIVKTPSKPGDKYEI
jgi:mannose-6-phosphate isomerase-like protein (cupin superfamily)